MFFCEQVREIKGETFYLPPSSVLIFSLGSALTSFKSIFPLFFSFQESFIRNVLHQECNTLLHLFKSHVGLPDYIQLPEFCSTVFNNSPFQRLPAYFCHLDANPLLWNPLIVSSCPSNTTPPQKTEACDTLKTYPLISAPAFMLWLSVGHRGLS